MRRDISGLGIVMLLLLPFFVKAQRKVQVIEFHVTDCNETTLNPELIRTRIITKSFVNGVLEVKIGTAEVCCRTFRPVSKYYSGIESLCDTLYLGYAVGGDECECDCYYEMTYKIRDLKKSDVEIRFRGKPIEFSEEKYQTYPVRYKVIGNDTLNLVDKYGLRQGRWTSDSSRIKKYVIYEDGEVKEEVLLFDNGNPRRIINKRDINNYVLIEYFESGSKKMECFNGPGGSYKNWRCKEWDVNGTLINEGRYEIKPN